MRGARKLLAIAIAATFIASTITLFVKPSAGHGTIKVTALFTRTIGLFPSSRVMVLGVAVGRVVSVTPAGNDVKVVMQIDKTRKVPADARATIVPISLISDRYVQLFPPYMSGPALATGDVIGTDRTFIPAELDDLLTQLKKLLDALEQGSQSGSPALAQLITNLSESLRGVGGDLSATLTGAGKLSATVLTRSADLDAIVVHLSGLISALAERRSDLVDLNTHLAEALGAIADERASFGGALANIALLTDQLSSLVHDHKAALETDLNTLAKTTQAIIRHQDSLERALEWTPVLDDGVEGHHNGGAVDFSGPGPVHVDVRDAHLTTCPPGVPVSVCVLLGLEGLLPSASAAQPSPGHAPAAAAPKQPPSASTPTVPNLLDLLPKLPLLGPDQPDPTPSSSPNGLLGGLLEKIGGSLDHVFGWLL